MGKVALITGSAVRIGRGIAGHLAEKGWSLALHYSTSLVEVSELESELRSKYSDQLFYSFKTDLGDASQTEKLIDQVIERFGSVDLLINNASAFEPGSLTQTDNYLLARLTMINFMTPFILMRDFAKKAGKGLIINI